MADPQIDPADKERMFQVIVAESQKVPEKGGWVKGLYPKLEKHGFSNWQIRHGTSELVAEGRLKRQGERATSMWKPEEVTAGSAPHVPPEEVIQSEEAVIAEAEPTDEDLVARINLRIEALRSEIEELTKDRDTILSAEPARQRAKALPPTE